MRRKALIALAMLILFSVSLLFGIKSSTAEAGYRFGWYDCRGTFQLQDGSGLYSHVCAWGISWDGDRYQLREPGASYHCVHTTNKYGGTTRRFWVMSGFQWRCGAWPNNGQPRWDRTNTGWVAVYR